MKLSNINIAIIGAGKIAYSIAGELKNNGYFLSSAISRNFSSAKELAKTYNIPLCSNRIEDVDKSANFYILSVPDGEIDRTAKEISKQKLNFKNKLFIHLSGSLSSAVLFPLREKGAKTASLHIMQTFPSKTKIPISGNYAAIESDNKTAIKLIWQLAESLKLVPFTISSEAKTNYHIASVFASNFFAGNLFVSQQKFNSAGIEKDAVKLLTPLIETTFANVKKTGAVKALSGPVERNDLKTIRRHISALKKMPDAKKEEKELNKLLYLSYLAQSLILTKVTEIKKEGVEEYGELKKLLYRDIKKLVNSF